MARTSVIVQAVLVVAMAALKMDGYINCGWIAVLSPIYLPWMLWLTGAILYFPYWYFYRRGKDDCE